ncbi:hypothetical protein ELR57_07075 [Cohnella sp. AR92]|nr:hypothetical protein ELR57_07075 [Cohnella sp. AR92]
MLKLRQYLCRHYFKIIANHRSVSENLWQCKKCGVYCIQHWGIGVSYLHKTPHIDGWIYKNQSEGGK